MYFSFSSEYIDLSPDTKYSNHHFCIPLILVTLGFANKAGKISLYMKESLFAANDTIEIFPLAIFAALKFSTCNTSSILFNSVSGSRLLA